MWSSANSGRLATFGNAANGYVQQLGGPLAIFINPDNTSGKGPLNILAHEIGHVKWPGLGVESAHDPLFYRLLNNSLLELGLPVNTQNDLKGVNIGDVPSPVPAGSMAVDCNISGRRGDAGSDDAGVDYADVQPGGISWVVSTDGTSISEQLFGADGDAAGPPIQYIYDPGGRLTVLSTAPNGQQERITYDPFDTKPWETHTIAIDDTGREVGDHYGYGLAAQSFLDTHSLTGLQSGAWDEGTAGSFVATIERAAYAGDAVSGGVDGIFTSVGPGRAFTTGTYDVDFENGIIDTNPTDFGTSLSVTESAFGYDSSSNYNTASGRSA